MEIEERDSRMDPAVEKLPLTEALGAEGLAITHYQLAFGNSVASSYRSHQD